MVYNAMKLFMEINPQLFDDCSHEYTESQNNAEQREAARKSKWNQIAEQAKRRQSQDGQLTSTNGAVAAKPSKIVPPPKIDEIDPVTQDSQKRLDALKLQDSAKDSEDKSAVSLSAHTNTTIE